jgi:DNA-binding MarR family transcriptional regulator
MTVPPDDVSELRQLLRRVTRGLWHRNRPPEGLEMHLHSDPPLGRRHLGVLMHVASTGPQTVTEIAGDLDLSLPAASKLTTELEEHLLVDRREHPDDRRRTLVDLNAVTAGDVRAWIDSRNRPLEAALGELDEAERAAFLKGLRALAAALMEESDRGSFRPHHRSPHRRRSHPHRPV